MNEPIHRTTEKQVVAQPLQRYFVLATQGDDRELDAIGIMLELLNEFQSGEEIARILEYVSKRFTRTRT